jgi:ABC-type transport system involved in multi-copper enzyme maturation permease subunit
VVAEPRPPVAAEPSRPKGEIHDLGYQRYVGPRRTAATRWQVITREQLSSAWKTWWRWKAALALAVVVTCVCGGLMFFLSDDMFRGMAGLGMKVLNFADGMLPRSIEWFCRCGAYASLVIGATVIAGDVDSGAFTFYFARSVRPRDYVLGKLVGSGLIVATVVGIGPIVLAALRLGLSDSVDDLIDHLSIVPRALAVGAVATMAYTAVPLGFSALVANRRHALALWAGYYFVLGTILMGVNVANGSPIVALDLSTAIAALSLDVFDVHAVWGRREKWHLTPQLAIASIGVQVVIAIAIVWWRVAQAQRRGVGGAS